MSKDYIKLNERFRGSEIQIKKNLEKNYNFFFNYLKNLNKNFFGLDLGSGRGEWLEILKQKKINALGIEVNQEFIKDCKKKRLEVIKGDALTFLKKSKNSTYDFITAFHLIEHFNYKNINILLKECFRVLTHNGILILETPNPENFFVSSLGFYNDYTHKTKLPPDLLQFYAKQKGFELSEIYRINGMKKVDIKKTELVKLLYEYSLDYTLIAQKKSDNMFLKKIKKKISNKSNYEIFKLYSNQLQKFLNDHILLDGSS